VRHEQLAIDQKNIGLNAAKAVFECIKERSFVRKIVVSMSGG
jgi:hypothetical protein